MDSQNQKYYCLCFVTPVDIYKNWYSSCIWVQEKKAKKADVMKSNWRIEKGNFQLFKKSESQCTDEKSK